MKKEIQILSLRKTLQFKRIALSIGILTNSILILFLSIFLLTNFIGCSKKSTKEYSPTYGETPAVHAKKIEYIFAVHPLHNSDRFFEIFQPLINYINSTVDDFTLKLESSKDYQSFEQKLYNRKFHFALPNPYQSVNATKYGYTVFGKMGDDKNFRGIILARKDSQVNKVSDLRGASISFPSATALAAAMMPKFYLMQKGLNVEKDAICRYVGSQESSIMNVYLGKTKAGCTWPPPWEMLIKLHPEVDAALEIVWQTEPLINNGLVVRNDIPKKHLEKVSSALFELQNNIKGKTILKRMELSCFEKIENRKYVEVVSAFLKKYKEQFGNLPNGERKTP
ncbi:MAG: phosphate/phosphite/phosphonate ABC transporter substrate-binding protein [Ignavibacteriaceae bacterium]|jgi:phosphonate transport system substrate-binding protein